MRKPSGLVKVAKNKEMKQKNKSLEALNFQWLTK